MKDKRHDPSQQPVIGVGLPPISEKPTQVFAQELSSDDQSSLSSMTALDPKLEKDIIKKFLGAIFKELRHEFSNFHSFGLLRHTFQQQFQSLLKSYSDQVKNDTSSRTRRQAAKRIRKLRKEIAVGFEDGVGDITPDPEERRIYPEITYEVEKVNPSQKNYKEKVGDWNAALLIGLIIFTNACSFIILHPKKWIDIQLFRKICRCVWI